MNTKQRTDFQELSERFERVCQKILSLQGYSAQSWPDHLGEPSADFVLSLPGQPPQIWVAETKFYRSSTVEPAILRNAASRLIKAKHEYQTMLCVSVFIGNLERQMLNEVGVDLVMDLQDLAASARQHPEFFKELKQILADAGMDSANVFIGGPTEQAELEIQGAQIASRLKGTTAGREGARLFEDLCCQAVIYLFGSHLGSLKRQNRIESGFQYMDAIAKVAPTNIASFWTTLAHDFKCRYVVFEFKNYAESISQNQIYVTEKYLYTHALRPLAVVIARNDADDNARRAVRSALREHGKIILILSMKDLVQMLEGTDQGNDPNDLLAERLDEMLTKMTS